MPQNYGDDFPVLLTYYIGVGGMLIDIMFIVFDKGIRSEAFLRLLLGLHSQKYNTNYLKHYNKLERLQLFGMSIDNSDNFRL